MTIDQLLADVIRAAEAMLAVQPQHGYIELKFHQVDANPIDVAAELAKALPGWPLASIMAIPADDSGHNFDCAWAEVTYQRVRITVFVAATHATAYLASLATAKAA